MVAATQRHDYPSAKVQNATQTDVTGLDWFKIYEDGLTVSDQSWGVDRLIANKGSSLFLLVSGAVRHTHAVMFLSQRKSDF